MIPQTPEQPRPEHNVLECHPEKVLINHHYECLLGRIFQLKSLPKSEIKMQETRFGQKVSGFNTIYLKTKTDPNGPVNGYPQERLAFEDKSEIYATVVGIEWTPSRRMPAMFGLIITEMPVGIFYAGVFDFCVYAKVHNLE